MLILVYSLRHFGNSFLCLLLPSSTLVIILPCCSSMKPKKVSVLLAISDCLSKNKGNYLFLYNWENCQKFPLYFGKIVTKTERNKARFGLGMNDKTRG